MATTRILVVDDEEDLCEILKFNLEIEGYEVDTAYSAEEALKKDLTVYNLLLLDVMMGEISGFKMARILRQDEKTANTPIIFLTAKDTENDMLTGFNLGADDYISKPFSIRQVIARVKPVLRRTSEKSKEKEIEKLEYETLALNGSSSATIGKPWPTGFARVLSRIIIIIGSSIPNDLLY